MTAPRRHLPIAAALALLAVLALVAGCGGGSKKEDSATAYKKETDAIGAEFKESVENANTRLQAATDTKGRLAGLEDMKQAVTSAADAFMELDPPAAIEGDNAMLVEQLRSFAKDIDTVAQAVRDEDAEAIRGGLRKIQEDGEAIQATLDRIEQKLPGPG